jgi:hypothetical protein
MKVAALERSLQVHPKRVFDAQGCLINNLIQK